MNTTIVRSDAEQKEREKLYTGAWLRDQLV